MNLDEYTDHDGLIEWFEQNPGDESQIFLEFLYHQIRVDVAAVRLIRHFQNQELYRLRVQRVASSHEPPPSVRGIFFQFLVNTIIPGVERFEGIHQPCCWLLATLKGYFGEAVVDQMLRNILDQKWREYGTPYLDYPAREEYQAAWTCLNTFVAVAHDAGLQDLSSYAIATLDMAWRGSGWRVKQYHLCELFFTDDIGAIEGHAPAAAAFISVCGKRLYSKSREVRAKWGKWKSYLEWIVRHQQLTAEMGEECQKALEEMKQIGK